MLIRVAVSVAVLVAAGLVLHRLVPGRYGSLLETFLPWLGLGVVPLLAVAAWLRTKVALFAALLPLVAWLGVFGGHLLPAGAGSAAAGPQPGAVRGHQPASLLVVQHNVSDENPDPAGTVRTLTAGHPDLVGLEEVTPAALAAYTAAFGADYPHHTVQGTVALWSRHPLTEAGPVDIRPAAFGADWNRGLRAVAHTPHGAVAVYVAHLPSVRINPGGLDCVHRDESARKLAAALNAEPLHRIVLLGDLNSTVDDRGLDPVAAVVSTVPSTFAFSWPAALPVARIDQIMARSVPVTDVWTLPRTGSDHLPLAARLTLAAPPQGSPPA